MTLKLIDFSRYNFQTRTVVRQSTINIASGHDSFTDYHYDHTAHNKLSYSKQIVRQRQCLHIAQLYEFEEPCNALCQLKSTQLLHNCTKKSHLKRLALGLSE